MKEQFKLDSSQVEEAEQFRAGGNVIRATEIATDALSLTCQPDFEDCLEGLVQDPEQLAIFACLARIQVDSLKSVASREVLPWKIVPPLIKAGEVIHRLYQNPTFQEAIRSVNQDHLDRPHYFATEMARDHARTCYEAAHLLLGRTNQLAQKGNDLLSEQLDSIPPDHPTRPLIAIELTLSKINHREANNQEKGWLLIHFNQLRNQDWANNPHRVATVASWLAVNQDPGISIQGRDAFREILAQRPEWDFMIDKEQKRIWRNRLVSTIGPFMTTPQQKDKLEQLLLT